MAILDSVGAPLLPPYEVWYDPNLPDEREEKDRWKRRRPASPPSGSQEGASETHYAVLCSEKQAEVIALPAQTSVFKHNITEASFVLRADVVQMPAGCCIACFCANGHIMALR